MEEHLVVFVDLLGFRSVIKSHGATRQEKILDLLTKLSDAEGNFGSKTRDIDANRREFSIRPAISAFSDNIVFSFPSSGIEQAGSGLIALQLSDWIAHIFTRAIRLGCLVRGGIAFGPLHHADGMVFGAGLLEAHELESKVARYPRIVIAETAARRLDHHPYMFRDEDGFACLDYLVAAYLQVPLGTDASGSSRRKWIASIRGHCKDQIALLEQLQNLAGLQNWRWFATRFERFVAQLHPTISAEDPEVG